jgi:tripartite-type tricarboxylate transporter receptor subunit TctC
MLNTEGSLKEAAYRFVHAVLVVSTLLTSGLWGIGAFAQSYPTKPIKLVVPFPAGGPADVLGRLITQKLSESWTTDRVQTESSERILSPKLRLTVT